MKLADLVLPEGEYDNVGETYSRLSEDHTEALLAAFAESTEPLTTAHLDNMYYPSTLGEVGVTAEIHLLPEPVRLKAIEYIDTNVPDNMIVMKVVLYFTLLEGTTKYMQKAYSRRYAEAVQKLKNGKQP